MSCSIPVGDFSTSCEYSDSLGTAGTSLLSDGRSSPYRSRSNQRQSLFNIFAFVTRTIYFRRLKLLKLYMAVTAIVILLFFLFRSSTTDKILDERRDISAIDTSGNHRTGVDTGLFTENSNAGLHYEKVASDSNDLSSTLIDKVSRHPLVNPHYSSSSAGIPRQHHVNSNVSFTLKRGDFNRISDINEMQVRIREAAKHSWDNYRRYAWGFDMLKPRAKEPDQWFDLGLTIVDSADTLIIMGLTDEADLALDWMENKLKFNSRNENSNCFELTIRILAGLLSAYHLTGSARLKQQVIEFGDILLHCYDTESGVIPFSDIDLSTRRAHGPNWNPSSSLSEVTSLQLEFRYLSQISGDPKYEQTTFGTSQYVHNLTENRTQKLLPMYINPTTGQFEDSVITLGARTDSYYEYLLKQYLQTGITWLRDDYLDSMDQVKSQLFRHTDGAHNYTYVAEMQIYRTANNTDEVRYYNKMDHLVCFLPGTLALGYYHFSPLAKEQRLKFNLEKPSNELNPRFDDHMDMAQELARTCYHMYSDMGTGLAPEIATFVNNNIDDPISKDGPEITAQPQSAHNILRPEYVESLFYLYHITGSPTYRDQARLIFEAFQKYSRIPSGYSPISDVRRKPLPNENIGEILHDHAPDRMESFWLGETLKYLYLVFCDDAHIVGTILNNYVFNTEAHLFPLV